MEEQIASLAQQLMTLQRDLQKETEERRALETQVVNLQKMLVDEQKKRKQITDWVRENIGPNLEHVTERVASNLKEGPKGESSSEKLRRRREPRDRDSKQSPSVPRSQEPVTSPAVTTKQDSVETTKKEQAPSGPVIDKINEPINLILERVEDHVFISKEYYDEVPQSDAFYKTNRPGRLNHFLKKRNHAQIKYNDIKLPDKAVHFANHHGGKLVFVPDNLDEDFAQDNFSLGIMPTDECYPVCPDGLVRSQIMHLVLKGVKRFLGCNKNEVNVEIPHGIMSGYDPFTLKGDQYRFLTKKNAVIDKFANVFAQTFGQPLLSRFGESRCIGLTPTRSLDDMVESNIRLDKLKETLREYFDLYYYKHSLSKTNRVIFFAFGNAVPILMDRLMEVNPTKNGLTGVIIVAVPFGIEELTGNLSKETLFDTYKLYSSLTGLIRV